MFRGIPFAAPPVGDLRWKAPQPVESWPGVRPADKFGPRCMQRAMFGDMEFRSNGMGEDCLYLNVWTPARSGEERLPVLVYFYGGGYRAGDGSEPRYDGASMAGKGIVAVTVNYRLGAFGFLAHPELSQEAPYHASGNYGLLDQNAALRWVQANIAAFGGDPKRVTIAGESAGSISVSAQVASPLSKDLIAGAILESGSLIGSMTPRPLSEAEPEGVKFATGAGAASIAALRAMTAEQVLELTAKPDSPRFGPVTDGYLLPKEVAAILDAGEQARVPLLGGSNSEEQSARGLLRQDEPTPENYAKAVRALYGDRTEEVLKLYPGSTPEEVLDSAMALAGDRFIGFSTWRFMEGHRKTGGQPVYRYYYSHPRPEVPRRVSRAPGRRRGNRPGGPAPATGRRALRRDRVRHGQPRDEHPLRVGSGGPQAVRGHAGVLRELHQDREPERAGPSELARVRRQGRVPGHAPRRGITRRAGGHPPRALPVPGPVLRQAPAERWALGPRP